MTGIGGLLACVGPACSEAAPATVGELLGVALVIVALAATTGAALVGLARYNR